MPVRPIDSVAPLATSPLASRFAVTHLWLPVAIGLPAPGAAAGGRRLHRPLRGAAERGQGRAGVHRVRAGVAARAGRGHHQSLHQQHQVFPGSA
ncbi:hypothetical protein G6F63_015912 [Rhizopus arrhizus]|nr:hypothetical protein G6F63_015912 [Rhizopus arrhizus]